MALTVVCGSECGIVTTGLGTAANRHWDAISGTPAIETSIVRSGAKSFRFPAAAFISLRRTAAALTTALYFRGYFYLTDATPSVLIKLIVVGNGGTSLNLAVSTAGVLQTTGWAVINGPTLSDNTWYGVELEVDVSTNPGTTKWRTWSAAGGWVSQTNSTKVQAATTISTVDFGCWGAATAETVYFDDVLMGESTVAGTDYDASNSKGGQVTILRPAADGTHSFTAGDFVYNAAGANIATNATDVYTYLDESDQQDITDFIKQAVIRATGYVEVGFGTASNLGTLRAVAVTSTHHAAGVNANTASLKVTDDGGTNLTAVWTDEDVSDTTAHFRHKALATKPSGGAWTLAALNALKARLGYSTDVTDFPYWDSVSLEAEWTTVASTAARIDPMGAAGLFGT